jgi:hypothetical protein
MGTRADELKSDLERQREALGHDLEAVGDRVSPGRVAERRRAAVRQRLSGARTRMTRARHRVMGTPATARDRAAETAGTARDRAAAAGERIAEAPRAVEHATEGNPLAAGVIAFGAGLLTAGLVPPTKPERRAAERLEPALSEAKEEAASAAKQAAEHLRPEAEDAAAQVRARASTAAGEVRSEATHAAEEVRTEATQATEEVRSEATQATEDVKDTARRNPGSGSDLGR